MKLRLRENSVRLRLLKSEIAQLDDRGFVSETIRFAPDQRLDYELRIDEGIDSISASFDDGKISIRLPSDKARSWLETNEVGLEDTQVTHEDMPLKLLIEKDFVCLTRPMEGDNLDAFPNPEAEAC